MIRSLPRRMFHAIVLLGIISIMAFALSKMVPGDEVLDYLSIDDSQYSSAANPLQQRTSYARVASKRGLDLPYFYLSITPGYYPDSLSRIVPADDRQAVKAWIKTSKNKTAALSLYTHLKSGLTYTCHQADHSDGANRFCQDINYMLRERDLHRLDEKLMTLQSGIAQDLNDPYYMALMNSLLEDFDQLSHSHKKLSKAEWLPAFHWHGINNQYHRWMSGCITFKPLTSLIDGRNAWTKILVALKWTLLLNGLAFLVAIFLGVVIGIWSGTHEGQRMERWVNVFLFALFALPSFWLATLFIYFLTSGYWFSIFPSGGLGPYQAADHLFERWGVLIWHLTLPVLCLALGSLAYVSRQMKQSVMHQLRQPYVLSLRTQGIREKTIVRRHVIRNALFPLITMIGGALPALLSGSLIIEVIFSIPGMGRLMYNSLLARDWPVAFPILMLGAAVTVVSYMLTDVVYKWADPRVKSIGP